DPEPGDAPHAHVLEDDVRARGEVEKERSPFGMLQVDRHAFLVAIQVDEIRRLVAVEGRPPGARDVTLERLDLDDLRAVIAEQRRCERARKRVRQVEHDYIVERRYGRCHDVLRFYPVVWRCAPSGRAPAAMPSERTGF